MADLRIKRIYDPYEESDGYRILVDRLWPRGVKKENAHIDKWMKDIAPSNALREQFDHQADKWGHFAEAYRSELKDSPALTALQADIKHHTTVTLLFAARDTEHNNALALQKIITAKL